MLAADGYSCRDIDECSCNTTAKRAACGGNQGFSVFRSNLMTIINPETYEYSILNIMQLTQHLPTLYLPTILTGCQQQCINTVGSYYCKCDSAYVPLRPDSTQCILPVSFPSPYSGDFQLIYIPFFYILSSLILTKRVQHFHKM